MTAVSSPLIRSSKVAASHSDGAVRLWDTGSRACVRDMKAQVKGFACRVSFSCTCIGVSEYKFDKITGFPLRVAFRRGGDAR